MILAARRWVCVRLATYEDPDEAKMLRSLFRTRSGELENTVFGLLGPDGEKRLGRSGRSPSMVFRDAAEMARAMDEAVAKHVRDGSALESPLLPLAEDLRLGLNLAASDGRPLVVAWGPSKEAAGKAAERLVRWSWSDDGRGVFEYAVAFAKEELEPLEGWKPAAAGIAVVEPGEFGVDGKVLAQVAADAPEKEILEALARGRKAHRAAGKDPRRHIEEGRRRGVEWESELPVTDPGVPPPGKGGR